MKKVNVEATLSKSKELRAASKFHEAIDLLSEAIKTSFDARLFFIRGKNFEMIGQLANAIANYTVAILHSPNTAEYYMNRGCVLSHSLENDEEAIPDFEKVLELEPSNVDAHCESCISLLLLGKSTQALEHATTAVKLAPSDARSHYCVGRSYMDLRQFSKAIDLLSRAVEIEPDNDNYWASLGSAHRFLGGTTELELAVRAYSRAIKLDPNSADYFYSRGQAQLQMGMTEQAKADFNHALTLNPDDVTLMLINNCLATVERE